MTKKEVDDLTYKIIGCAIEVHKELGPGLLESVYEKCFIQELLSRNLSVKSQVFVPLHYKGIDIDCGLRLDVLVNDLIVVEIKAVDVMLPIFSAQLLTYLRLLEKPKGILINFNCANIFKEGQKTFVNEFYSELNDF
jgi:GxxExxY protein